MTRWYPIECEHGYDACPICDSTKTFPSGAKASTRKFRGGTVAHLALPYHEDDLFEHLRAATGGPHFTKVDWDRLHLHTWPEPARVDVDLAKPKGQRR